MAIYHFSAQVISRGKGQSAVAAASYRSGEQLEDERTGETKFYKRKVKPETMILSPSHSPEWVKDRQRLWNEVEKIERRKDAQLAREFNVALPKELSNDQQRELIKGYVQDQFVDRGMVADISIHRDDKNNPHAHVMLTTRDISEDGFGKKNRDWNQKELLEQWREQWSDHANKALEKAHVKDRITHLSNKDRGLEVLPTVHLGHVAHEMESKGVPTERGTINAERQAYNAVVIDLQNYREEKKALEEKLRQKQYLDKISTPQEKISLSAAEQLMGNEPTIKNIQGKIKEIKEDTLRLEATRETYYSLEKEFESVDRLYKDIKANQEEILFAERQKKNIKSLNLFKIKANNEHKERLDNHIKTLNEAIDKHSEALKPYKDSLDFKDEDEFYKLKTSFEQTKPRELSKVVNQLIELKDQQTTLENAQKSFENRFVRSLAQKYPRNPEIAYIDFKTAIDMTKLSNRFNKSNAILIEDFKELNEKLNIQKDTLKEKLESLKQKQVDVGNLKSNFELYKGLNGLAEKYEKSPLYKGKIENGMNMPPDYRFAKEEAQKYSESIKRTGIKNMEQIPEIKANLDKEIETIESRLGRFQSYSSLVGGIIEGINQATQEMERANEKKQRRLKRSRSHENELER